MQLWIGYKRFILFIIGIFLISFGVILSINARLGVSPWDVFHIGLANHTHLTMGEAIQVVGLTLILISWFLGYKPDIGTFLNMYLIGYFYDWIDKLKIIKPADGIYNQLAYFIIGLIIFAFGTSLYINASWGGGPRDSLMLALKAKFKVKISFIRTIIEISVLVLGFAMGGPVGIGTVIFSLSIGFLLEFFLRLTSLSKLHQNR